MTTRENDILDAAGQLHIINPQLYKACASKAEQDPQEEGSWAPNSTPSCKATGNLLAAMRGQTVFSGSVVPGKSTLLQWKTTYPEISGEQKLVLRCLKRKRNTLR